MGINHKKIHQSIYTCLFLAFRYLVFCTEIILQELAKVSRNPPSDLISFSGGGRGRGRMIRKYSKPLPSLKLTHMKIGRDPNRKVVFPPSIFRGELLVSGRVLATWLESTISIHLRIAMSIHELSGYLFPLLNEQQGGG